MIINQRSIFVEGSKNYTKNENVMKIFRILMR
jgi:hypothetical protein